jgi:hypothetical protein
MSLKLRPVLLSLLLSAFGLFFPAALRGQFIGYVSPQTSRTVVANAVTCPGGGVSASVAIPNLGNTTHFVTYTTTGTPNQLNVSLSAIEGGNFLQISDSGTQVPSGTLSGNGYYAQLQVNYSCFGNGGTITVVYYGVSGVSVPVTGLADEAAYSKTLAAQQTSGGPFAPGINPTPYGNTCGRLHFNNIATVTGTTVTATITESPSGAPLTILPTTTVASSGETVIPMPCFPARFINFSVTPGAVGNYSMQYDFIKPGAAAIADPCQSPGVVKQSVPIAISTATTTQLVALNTNQAIYVCGVSMTIAPSATTADTATLEYGTGANCGTGTTVLTGAFGAGDLTTAAPPLFLSFADPGTTVKTPFGQALCLLSAGTTVNIQGVLTFVQW